MNNFKKNGDQYNISIKPDSEGYVGRECPKEDCKGYFKIKLGTGIEGNYNCYCPHCGYIADHNEFWTPEQIEYAKSVALHEITGEVIKELKKHEIKSDPKALFGIDIKIKGKKYPIYHYHEKKLEQYITCENCSLEYTIYGVFGYCPDCGIHNSLQILNTNIKIIEKMLSLSENVDSEISNKLIENALEDTVSAFDGFGREICKVNANKSSNPNTALRISFQNIYEAKNQMIHLFNIDIQNPLSSNEWTGIYKSFQKRHLMAHKMGVIDQKYIDNTGENPSLLGRKVKVTLEEIKELIIGLEKMGKFIFTELENI